MNTQLLRDVLTRFRVPFLASFTALSEQDYQTLLAAQPEALLTLLQERYGYTPGQAKAAWNEFVLRHVDGRGTRHPPALFRNEALNACRSPRRVWGQNRDRRHCLGIHRVLRAQ